MCQCLWKSKGSIKSPGAGVVGGYKSNSVGAGN